MPFLYLIPALEITLQLGHSVRNKTDQRIDKTHLTYDYSAGKYAGNINDLLSQTKKYFLALIDYFRGNASLCLCVCVVYSVPSHVELEIKYNSLISTYRSYL